MATSLEADHIAALAAIIERTLPAVQAAETYVDVWLQCATAAYGQAVVQPPAVDTTLLELDGCEIRTGVLMTAANAGLPGREPLDQRQAQIGM
jgi:hypothetical protein